MVGRVGAGTRWCTGQSEKPLSSSHRIRRALISVYDKTGVVEFARALHEEFGVELISTGGTAKVLTEAGIPVTPIEQITGFGELLDGRVKTLHPKIFAAILADRDNPQHLRQLAELGVEPIDMVVVNLYPFEQTVADSNCTFEQAIEMIDIGGVALLRAAAKNHKHVLAVLEVESYPVVLDALRESRQRGQPVSGPLVGEALLLTGSGFGAFAVFLATVRHDAAIAEWISSRETTDRTPVVRFLEFICHGRLRYGENPHTIGELLQENLRSDRLDLTVADSFADQDNRRSRFSYNNYLDADAALGLCAELTRAGPRFLWDRLPAGGTHDRLIAGPTHGLACVFVKHTNPCGVGIAPAAPANSRMTREERRRAKLAAQTEAYRRAYLGDPNAAMGGILACNFEVDAEFAAVVMETYDRFGKPLKEAGAPFAPGGFFLEVWLAPAFTEEAVQVIRGVKPVTAPGDPSETGPTLPPARPKKKWGGKVRLLAVGDMAAPPDEGELVYRSIAGGMLVQTPDLLGLNEEQWQVVTKRTPDERELADLRCAWLIAKHTKSNAVSIVRDGMLIGNGAGQMSRAMSCRIAVWLARENGHGQKLAGAVAASDGFFPFRDGPDVLIDAGVTAIIQPGGSKRDAEVIAACDERGVAMIFTGTRHFRH